MPTPKCCFIVGVNKSYALYVIILQLELTKHITPHANDEPLLQRSSSHSYSSPVLLLVVWTANGDGSAITSKLASKASSKVNLLNNNTCQRNSATVIVSSFGQIEQGAH